MITYVEKVENHYWEADGLNEELLERFIITNSSDSESSDDEGVNEGFSEGDSTSFGSMSESTDSSDDEVGIIRILEFYILRFLYMFRNEGMAFPLAIHLNSSNQMKYDLYVIILIVYVHIYSR